MILMSLHAMTEIFFGSGLSQFFFTPLCFSLHISLNIWSRLAHAPTQQVSLTEAWKKLIIAHAWSHPKSHFLTLKERKRKKKDCHQFGPWISMAIFSSFAKNTRGNGKKWIYSGRSFRQLITSGVQMHLD